MSLVFSFSWQKLNQQSPEMTEPFLSISVKKKKISLPFGVFFLLRCIELCIFKSSFLWVKIIANSHHLSSSRHANKWPGLSKAACACWRTNLYSPGPGLSWAPSSGKRRPISEQGWLKQVQTQLLLCVLFLWMSSHVGEHIDKPYAQGA